VPVFACMFVICVFVCVCAVCKVGGWVGDDCSKVAMHGRYMCLVFTINY